MADLRTHPNRYRQNPLPCRREADRRPPPVAHRTRRAARRIIEIDPVVPDVIALVAEPEEVLNVRVDSTTGWHYWFSDRRLLRQHDQGIDELPRYEAVNKAHWMFRDIADRLKSSPEAAAQLKANYFDRLEIESENRLVVLEGLGQAYWPALHFF